MFEFIDTPNPNAKKIMVEHNFEISIYLDAESIEDKNLKNKLENLSIKLVIGNRSYPMKVPIEDEQKIRNIGKDLNKRISEIKSQMNIDDLQDILAMIAFKLSVELEDNKGQTSENKDAYKKIENIINEIDKKLE